MLNLSASAANLFTVNGDSQNSRGVQQQTYIIPSPGRRRDAALDSTLQVYCSFTNPQIRLLPQLRRES